MGRCVSVSQIMLSSKAEGPAGAFGGGPKCWAGMRGLSSGTAEPSDTTDQSTSSRGCRTVQSGLEQGERGADGGLGRKLSPIQRQRASQSL